MKKLYAKVALFALSCILAGAAVSQPCNNGTIPYSENFDGVTAPALPPCVIVENTNGDARAWTVLQGIFSGSTSPNIITYTTNPSLPANDWFFVKGLSLSGGVSYAVSFRYLGTANKPEKIEVRAGTAATGASAAAGPQIFNKTDITTFGNGSGIFTPVSTGVYYIGFHIYSDAAQNVAAIDNISVDLVPAVPACSAAISPVNGATNVSIPPTLNWTAVPTAVSYDLYLGTNGISYSLLGNFPGTSKTLTGTNANTTYYWYVAPRNAAGAPTTCQSTASSFTTTANVAPNDSCGASLLLSAGVPVSATTINATSSLPPVTCGAGTPAGPTGDVWFRFTATSNGSATISVTNPAGGFDPAIVAYTGTPGAACSGLTYAGCVDQSGGGVPENLLLNSVVAGTTYYIRVYGDFGEFANTFSIQVSGTALPVSLTNLKAERNGGSNRISWTTLTEQNNRGFELLRSVDGANYNVIGTIGSKGLNGNSSAALDYELIDSKPFSGNNYYKLRQIDKDGKETYTNIVIVKGIRAASLQLLSIYPNPAANNMNLVIGSPAAQGIKILVTDVAGKIIMQQSRQVIAGDNNLSLQISSLSAGNYFIRLVCDNGCDAGMSKFTKQ